jgi:hypothetical protein
MVSMLRSFMLLAGHAKCVLCAAVMTSVLSSSVFGQTYTIKTAAGGGLPVNIPGTSSSLGRIDGVAPDRSGCLAVPCSPAVFPKIQDARGEIWT